MGIEIARHGSSSPALDLDVLLRTRMLVQANSGGGKSWLLRRLAEQLFGRVPVVVIDPDGDFATLREKFGFVLAGKGGETPADPRSASLLAERLLELGASCVCDLYDLKRHERHHWVRLFLEGLMNAPKILWKPLVVIVDEAHLWAPEKGAGESEAAAAMIDLATRGRRRGFCAIWATQRLGKLRKDGAAELGNVAIGRTIMDVDRDRAADALGVSRSDRLGFDAELRSLSPGEFFCLGPAISATRVTLKVGGVQTSHPEAGVAAAAAPPPAPEQVKRLLPQLSDLPKAAEARAHTEAELRAEIRSLRSALSARPKPEVDEATVAARVERAVREATAEAAAETAALRREAEGLRAGVAALAEKATALAAAPAAQPLMAVPAKWLAPVRTKPLPPRTSAHKPSERAPLRAGAMRMLTALCQWYPQGMSDGQLRAMVAMAKSGTYSTYMGELVRSGWVEKRDGLLWATVEGLEARGNDIPAAPSSTEEVLALWRPKLREGARRILDVLVEARGRPLDKIALAEAAVLANSGTYSTYLGDLRRANLIVVRDGAVAANRESLFL